MIDVENFSEDNVEIFIHNISDLREEFSEWDSLSKMRKMELSREVSPIRNFSTHNTTCVGLNEYIVDNLDKDQSVDFNASHLAVGDDNTSPSSSNTDLNNEVGRFSVTSTSDNGSDLQTSTFIDTSEGNGNTFREIGLVNQSSTSGDILFNHSTISEIVKTNTKTATIEVTLSFTSA